jgi:hypothetical protein
VAQSTGTPQQQASPPLEPRYEVAVANAAGARAEQALRTRHRQTWPRDLYCYDADEPRRATGRKLLLESPSGRLAVSAEYKAADEGPLDLNDLQFELAADAVANDLPAYAVQFTHPELQPAQPWAFRLWPLNDASRALGPGVELTERGYVQFLYVLQRGVASVGTSIHGLGARPRPARAGGTRRQTPLERFTQERERAPSSRRALEKAPGFDTNIVVTTWMNPWAELTHLDDRWPDPAAWPDVVAAKPRTLRRHAPPDRLLVRRFMEENGRLLGEQEPSPVVQMPRRRIDVAPGPVSEARRRLAERATPAPVHLGWSRASADRWERLKLDLDRHYRAIWAAEQASEDNRDLWRAWDADGSPRWSLAGVA